MKEIIDNLQQGWISNNHAEWKKPEQEKSGERKRKEKKCLLKKQDGGKLLGFILDYSL